jgi:hypothetical protein
MLFAKIDGIDFAVISASISWKQSEAADFNFEILQKELVESQIIPYLKDVSLVFAGNTIVSGIVYDEPQVDIKNGLVVSKVHAYDEVGRLIAKMSRFGAHYQNIDVIAIVGDLLGSTSDWELGDISTMIDPTETSTIDLRSKEVLWSQVSEVTKSIPGLFVRYGGVNESNGKFQLDMGNFGEISDLSIADSENIVSISKEKSSGRQYIRVRAIGGKSGSTTVTLEHAANFDPTLLVDPDFPISNTTNGWIVTNNALSDGFEVAKKFTTHKPRNDTPPTAAETNEAGYGLYLQTRRFMERNAEFDTLSVDVVSNIIPVIDERFFVNTQIKEKVYDYASEVPQSLQTFNVNDFYRATSISLNFNTSASSDTQSEAKTENSLLWSLELTNGEYAEKFDDETIVYEQLEPHDQSDTLVVSTPPQVTAGTDTHGFAAGADIACFPSTAKIFSVALPAIPPGSIGVMAAYSVSDPAAEVVSINQSPAFPATGWQGCVQYAGSWPPPAPISITVTVYFIFLF